MSHKEGNVFTCSQCGKLRDIEQMSSIQEDGQLVGVCCDDHDMKYTYEDM